jgi:hypothetical protein
MNPPHAASPSHISEVRLRSDVARTIDGGGLFLALIHPSAPAVHVRKSRDSRKNLVPVLFTAGSLSSGADLHRMSDGMIMLIHNVAASDASTFLLAPFLFNRFGDPRRFCAVLSTALQSTSEHRDITWFIDHLHVTIIEGGIGYEAIPVGDTLMASGTICR